MKKSYIADDIMQEYVRKRRYEANKQRKEIEEFRKNNCINCENKNTNLCSITMNIKNELQCVFKKMKL